MQHMQNYKLLTITHKTINYIEQNFFFKYECKFADINWFVKYVLKWLILEIFVLFLCSFEYA